MKKRIEHMIFGYYDIKIEAECIPALLSRAREAGVSLQVTPEGCLRLLPWQRRQLCRLLTDIPYTEGALAGLPGALMGLIRRPGRLVAGLLTLCAFLYAGGAVWDVRVVGTDALSAAAVLAEAEAAGLTVGTRWRTLDASAWETAVLSASEDIGWISLDRRGTVAYVTVGEKRTPPAGSALGAYANLVASVDCVIEEITVESGVAAVQAGDVVRAGELLISGVIPDEVGGGFCRAAGTVRGRVRDRLSVTVARTETVREYGETSLRSLELQILDFSINIFKRYGNIEKECVIIEGNRRPLAFSRYPLPVVLRRTESLVYQERCCTRTDDELVSLAGARLRARMLSSLAGAELLSAATSGTFTDEGYEMTVELCAVREVGRLCAFAD